MNQISKPKIFHHQLLTTDEMREIRDLRILSQIMLLPNIFHN